MSAQPGLIPQMSGFLTNLRITGATVFVDHYSDHVFVYLMKNLTLEETLVAKTAYERFLQTVGVTAQAYHADNGRFADKGFIDACRLEKQLITFCGVGAHHQNGIAERYIKSLTLGGRTLLLHAKRMLPEYISTILWPFAIKCYAERMNHLTWKSDGRTPFEALASLDPSPLDVKSFHTFGSPCYVLDNRLQSGLSMVPKWDRRARMGIYVGRSPAHASNIALVLNPRTGHVSPQFHVVYDEDFTTVPYLRTGQVPPHWAKLVSQSAELVVTNNSSPSWESLSQLSQSDEGDFSTEDANAVTNSTASSTNIIEEPTSTASKVTFAVEEDIIPTVQEYHASNKHDPVPITQDSIASNERDPVIGTAPQQNHASNELGSMAAPDANDIYEHGHTHQMPEAIDLHTSGLRRSRRIANLRKRGDIPIYSHMSKHMLLACVTIFGVFCAIGSSVSHYKGGTSNACTSVLTSVVDGFHRANSLCDETLNCFSTAALSASATNEVFTFKEAMQQEDKRLNGNLLRQCCSK